MTTGETRYLREIHPSLENVSVLEAAKHLGKGAILALYTVTLVAGLQFAGAGLCALILAANTSAEYEILRETMTFLGSECLKRGAVLLTPTVTLAALPSLAISAGRTLGLMAPTPSRVSTIWNAVRECKGTIAATTGVAVAAAGVAYATLPSFT